MYYSDHLMGTWDIKISYLSWWQRIYMVNGGYVVMSKEAGVPVFIKCCPHHLLTFPRFVHFVRIVSVVGLIYSPIRITWSLLLVRSIYLLTVNRNWSLINSFIYLFPCIKACGEGVARTARISCPFFFREYSLPAFKGSVSIRACVGVREKWK